METSKYSTGAAEGAEPHLNRAEMAGIVHAIRAELNPYPAGQQEFNVPVMDGERLSGMQHKYRETVLFFPSQGQTCHSYCNFCFRWAQFVGDKALRFASGDVRQLTAYLRRHLHSIRRATVRKSKPSEIRRFSICKQCSTA